MRNKISLLTCLGVLGAAAPAWSGEVAYVNWSRAADDSKKTWGYNAFDGTPHSAWCSGDDGVGDVLTLGFIGDQKIDEIGLIVGALVKGKLDTSRARVKEIAISDGKTKQVLSFRDKPTMQSIKIKPGLMSQKMAFEVTQVYPGERRSAPVCISEIVLRKGGRAITGEPLKSSFRGLSKSRQKLLNLWIDQPGAPERYLTLGVAGNFRWVYEPILDGKRRKLRGTWSLAGSRLTVKTSGGKVATVRVSTSRIADGMDVFNQLVIEGEGPHKAFAATYQAAPPMPK